MIEEEHLLYFSLLSMLLSVGPAHVPGKRHRREKGAFVHAQS